MRRRPIIDGRQVAFVDQLCKRDAPVMPQISANLARSAKQLWQIGSQIVSTPTLELRQQVRRPIRAVHFQAVAENCIRRLVTESLHQWISHKAQVIMHCTEIEMIQYEALSMEGRTFYLLTGAC